MFTEIDYYCNLLVVNYYCDLPAESDYYRELFAIDFQRNLSVEADYYCKESYKLLLLQACQQTNKTSDYCFFLRDNCFNFISRINRRLKFIFNRLQLSAIEYRKAFNNCRD